MSSVSSGREAKYIFQELIPKLDELICKLDDTERRGVEDFSHPDFWKNFVAAVKLLSHEATKLCTAFSKPPLPVGDECQSLANSILVAVETFCNIFLSLPNSKGSTLRGILHTFVVMVVKSAKHLCLDVKNSSNSQLVSVGTVWEKCEAVEELPKDNKDAVLIVFRGELSLVDDATKELTDAIENDNEDLEEDGIFHAFMQNGIRIPCPNKWTDSDRRLVHSCLGLVKAYRACLKKTSASISAHGNAFEDHPIAELDEVANFVKSSSSMIDDLVCSLYPPANHNVIRCHASLVKEKSKTLLSIVQSSHFCSEADKLWVDFLLKAVDHNWAQIIDRVVLD